MSSAYGAGKGRLDGKWLPAYTEAIRGAKRVIYIPDNDDAGEKLCAYVCEQLIGKVGELATLHLVDYLRAEERERFAKGDFTDWAHEMQAGRGWKREERRKGSREGCGEQESCKARIRRKRTWKNSGTS